MMNDVKTPRILAELTDIEMNAVSGGRLDGEDLLVLQDSYDEGFSTKRKFISDGSGASDILRGGNGRDF